jgi:hypothetical protein
VVRTIAIPPGGVAQLSLPGGIAFSAGIGITVTAGALDNDTTAASAAAVVGDLFFA